MPAILTIYPAYEEFLLRGTIASDTDVLKIAYLSSAYTPTDAHEVFADVSASEIAAAGGYVAGGLTIGSATVTRVGSVTTFDLPDVDTTASGGGIAAHRWAVAYAAVTRNGKVNPIMFRILGNDAGGGTDIPLTPSGTILRYQFNPLGVFTI